MSPKCFLLKKKLHAPEADPEGSVQSAATDPILESSPVRQNAVGQMQVFPFVDTPQAPNCDYFSNPVGASVGMNSGSCIQPQPLAPRCIPPPAHRPTRQSGCMLGNDFLASDAPRIVLPPAMQPSSTAIARAPQPRVVLPPEMPPVIAPRVVFPRRLEELKERLVKRRRTEDLDRPPGDFGERKDTVKVPLDRPPGDCSASMRPSGHRKHRNREARDHAQDQGKTHDGRRCHRKDSPGEQTPQLASSIQDNSTVTAGNVSEGNLLATSPSKTGLVNAPWRAQSSQSLLEVTNPNIVRTIAQTAPPVAPWRRSALEQSSSAEAQCAAQSSATLPTLGSAQITLSSGGSCNSMPDVPTGELMRKLDEVAPQPDLAELLRAVAQVVTDVVPSSPENVDEGSATEDTATEDTDYDPFEVGSELPDVEDEDEDEGIVEALFDILRSAEESTDDPDSSRIGTEMPVEPTLTPAPALASTPLSAPRNPTPAKDLNTQTSTPKEENARAQRTPIPIVMHEEEERPKQLPTKTTYVFNAATQRWEPKKVAMNPDQKRPPKTAPLATADARMGTPRATIFVDDEPPIRVQAKPPKPQQSYVVVECEAQARVDIVDGTITYPQALAVRLALRFESKPEEMLKTMEEAGLPAAKDQRSTVKAIMRLCHPDKCKHPLAKRAMQAMGPLL